MKFNITPPKITVSLVKNLIEEQFPQYTHLPILEVEKQGHDNRTFRLGKEMLVRLPSSEGYVRQVEKEHKWLKVLAPHLPLPVPEPIAMGKPSLYYPWIWSIYRWLDGKSANSIEVDDELLNSIALELAHFLKALHQFDPAGAPTPGLHNWWRAAHTSVYDSETRALIIKLKHLIDESKATSIWERAIASKWNKDPVWVHGDVASGNILVKDNKLGSIIDFGCMGIGDPACDLTIAWTFCKNKSREKFRSSMDLDSDTWDRARGWALWKALYELSKVKDESSPEALTQRQIINDVLDEN